MSALLELAYCKYCGNPFRRRTRPRRGRKTTVRKKIRSMHNVTCSAYCSKMLNRYRRTKEYR